MQNRKKPYAPKQRKGPRPAESVEDVYNYAVWYLSKFGEASEKKMRERMKNKTENGEWIDQVIHRLIEQGYQSDSRYADMIVRNGVETKAWGANRIAQELAKKGIPNDIAKEALSVLSEDDPLPRAKEAIDKKFRGRQIQDQKERAKATRFLATRGFGFDCISSAIQQHNEEIQEEEDDTF